MQGVHANGITVFEDHFIRLDFFPVIAAEIYRTQIQFDAILTEITVDTAVVVGIFITFGDEANQIALIELGIAVGAEIIPFLAFAADISGIACIGRCIQGSCSNATTR